jgi:hypothetical protein
VFIGALKYGESLQRFEVIKDAEKFFFNFKNELIKHLELICQGSDFFTVDYKVEYLKKMEKS